jgi:hypothetical protein
MTTIFIELNEPTKTLWFKNPISTKGSTISLSSCSFTNHMCNLKTEGMLTIGDKVWLHVPKGNYDAAALHHLFASAGHEVGDIVKVQPIKIILKDDGWAAISVTKNVMMSDSLVKLLNIGDDSKTINTGATKVIKIIQPPKVIQIHCDLVDNTKVMYNDEYQQLLSVIDVGDCGNKVRHPAFHTNKPMKNGDYASSMRLKITDTNGTAVLSGVYPMVLEIEIA